MDLHYKQEVTVGVLVLTGVALFLGGTMWLKGNRFSAGDSLVPVMFEDAGTLKKGSVVRVSGVNLGAVEQIEFQEVGKVLVRLSLSPKVTPKIDATARLATVGLVADAVILFHPGTSTTPLPEGQVIQGTVDQGLTELGTAIGEDARTALSSVSELANKRLADNLNATLEAMQRFMAVYSNTRQGPAADMSATMASLQQLSARLDSTLAAANLPGTVRRTDSLLASATTASNTFAVTGARLDTLLQRINRGDGTIGKLMTDSLLYDDVRRVTQALEKLIDELRRHPGKITIQIKPF